MNFNKRDFIYSLDFLVSSVIYFQVPTMTILGLQENLLEINSSSGLTLRHSLSLQQALS